MSIEFMPCKKVADVNCLQKILPIWQFFLRLIWCPGSGGGLGHGWTGKGMRETEKEQGKLQY